MAFEGKIHADTSCSYEAFATIRLKNDVPEYLRYIALMPYHVTWYGLWLLPHYIRKRTKNGCI